MNDLKLMSGIAIACNPIPITSESKYILKLNQIHKIKEVLEKGDRVELIPCKDGIKIIQETRKEVK